MTTRHGTLVAATVTTVSVTGDRNEVGITHKNNVTDPIYARCDGTNAAVAATDTYTILPGQTRWIPRPATLASPTVVTLISAGTPAYELELP